MKGHTWNSSALDDSPECRAYLAARRFHLKAAEKRVRDAFGAKIINSRGIISDFPDYKNGRFEYLLTITFQLGITYGCAQVPSWSSCLPSGELWTMSKGEDVWAYEKIRAKLHDEPDYKGTPRLILTRDEPCYSNALCAGLYEARLLRVEHFPALGLSTWDINQGLSLLRELRAMEMQK